MIPYILITIIILTAALYFFALAPETGRRGQMSAYRGIMFAHRGYHCLDRGVPENSMSAFRAALKKGYGIELDLHLTEDGRVAVFHDDTLVRACRIKKRPEQMSAAKLKACRLFGTDERIPLLEDVLALVKGQVPLLIELKLPTRSTKLCEKAYELLKNYRGPYLVQSFNTEGLYWFRRNAPHILRGQLASNLTKSGPDNPWLLRFAAKHLLVNFRGRPDFISYKLADLPTFNTTLLKKGFGVPFAVWTLRDRAALAEGVRNYDMQIFEKSGENY